MKNKKGFLGLFKTKAEQKAYAIGRRHQYNKEHPKLKWGVETTTYNFNEDGSHYVKPWVRVHDYHKYSSKKQAEAVLKRAIEDEENSKMRVLKAVKNKKVNIYDSADCSYNDYRLVKINERKK